MLATIRDVSALSPSTSVSEISAADRILEDDLVRAAGSLPLDGDWVMRNTVRAETLRAMSDQDIRDALQSNPQERTGRVQSIFEDLLMQREVAVHDLDERGLEGLLQAIVWLKDVQLTEDVAAAARQRLAWIRFASHFERMAGDAVFFGRVSEMDQLRSHVGVLPPARLLQKIKNLVGKARPALSLSGPGSIGKSALAARFALEHLRIDERVRIPVAYLDFDRADRDIGDPIDPLTYIAPDGDTCLHIAAHRGNLRAVQLLVKAGLDPDRQGDMGYTALHYASTPEVVEFLLGCGASRTIKNEFGKSPVGWKDAE